MLTSFLAMLAAQAATTTPPTGDAPTARQIVVVGQPPATVDRVICRTMVETGSRMGGTRVCHRQSEWEQERRQHQVDDGRHVSDTQDYGYQTAPRRAGPQ
jgi:hypothetical protein